MGCLLAALAGLLALAIPAAIARASLLGAYLIIALLAALALSGLRWRGLLTAVRAGRLAGITLAYAAVVTGVHFIH